MSINFTKGFSPGLLFLGCLLIFSSFFDPKSATNTDLDLRVAQQDNDILVSVKSGKTNNKTQFYMFNMDGDLVKEYDISGSKKIIIKELQKGIYTYEFFSNDQRLKNGKIDLK